MLDSPHYLWNGLQKKRRNSLNINELRRRAGASPVSHWYSTTYEDFSRSSEELTWVPLRVEKFLIALTAEPLPISATAPSRVLPSFSLRLAEAKAEGSEIDGGLGDDDVVFSSVGHGQIILAKRLNRKLFLVFFYFFYLL